MCQRVCEAGEVDTSVLNGCGVNEPFAVIGVDDPLLIEAFLKSLDDLIVMIFTLHSTVQDWINGRVPDSIS